MPKRGGASSSRRSPSPSGSEDSEVSAGAGSKVARSSSAGFRKPVGARAPSAKKRAQDTVARAEEAYRRAVLASNDAIVARDTALSAVGTAFGPEKGPALVGMVHAVFKDGKLGESYDKALVLGTAIRLIAEQLKSARASQEAKDTLKSARVRVARDPFALPPPLPFSHTRALQIALDALKSHESEPQEIADAFKFERDASQEEGEGAGEGAGDEEDLLG